jgi:enamine deaminase RidA (YjgF/YER057c/UK114 family)
MLPRHIHGDTPMTATERLRELSIEIPEPWSPVANFALAVTTGNLVFISGHGPRRPDGTFVSGKLGRDLTVGTGYEAARLTALQCLASLQAEVGSLDRVRRVVKLLVMVNCTEDFVDQPAVANGASDLLVEIFGEAGRHARSAVGMQMLPQNIAVEVEMVVEVDGSE